MDRSTRRLGATKRQAERKLNDDASKSSNKPVSPRRKVKLQFVLRDYPLHERIDAIVKTAKCEDDVGDAIVALLSAVRKLTWSLNARHRANVGELLHEHSVSVKRSTIRIVTSKPPHRVTSYPLDYLDRRRQGGA